MHEAPTIDLQALREAIQHEYEDVAATPSKGFHFHVGRELTRRLDYSREEVDSLPESVVESFAGFVNVQFSDVRYDTFSDAPQASSAESFGTQGVNFRAEKPCNSETTE